MNQPRFSVRLTKYIHTVMQAEVVDWYTARAEKAGVTRSAVIREILIDYYEKHSRKPVNRREYQP